MAGDARVRSVRRPPPPQPLRHRAHPGTAQRHGALRQCPPAASRLAAAADLARPQSAQELRTPAAAEGLTGRAVLPGSATPATAPQEDRMTVTANGLDELKGMAGTDLGHTGWLEITQDRVDGFADATDDHQWIHVDRERAAAGPFGGTIAHGFLTLSLVIPLLNELVDVKGVSMGINYGLNKVRFTAPGPGGSKVRLPAPLGAGEDAGLHAVPGRTGAPIG